MKLDEALQHAKRSSADVYGISIYDDMTDLIETKIKYWNKLNNVVSKTRKIVLDALTNGLSNVDGLTATVDYSSDMSTYNDGNIEEVIRVEFFGNIPEEDKGMMVRLVNRILSNAETNDNIWNDISVEEIDNTINEDAIEAFVVKLRYVILRDK